MSINKTDDAVAEYLHELELRLTGLPVLQRRELLADLEAHITSERFERAVVSEGEVLEILERLGSPEVVAAAAYEEAGLRQPPAAATSGPAAARRLPPVPPPPDAPPLRDYGPPLFAGPPMPPPFVGRPPAEQGGGAGAGVALVLGVVVAVIIAFGCLAGAFFLARGSAAAPIPEVGVVRPAVSATATEN